MIKARALVEHFKKVRDVASARHPAGRLCSVSCRRQSKGVLRQNEETGPPAATEPRQLPVAKKEQQQQGA